MPDELVAEIKWWLDIVRMANHLHGNMPAGLREDIDAAASASELARMAGHMATVSSATRRRVERVLLAMLDLAGGEVSPSPQPVAGLRLVVS